MLIFITEVRKEIDQCWIKNTNSDVWNDLAPLMWCIKGLRGIPKADEGEVSGLVLHFKLLKEQQTELRQKKFSLTHLTSVETFGSSPRSPPFGAVMSTVISLICIVPTPATCERHHWAFSSKRQTCLWLALTQGLITAGEWDVDLYREAWVLFSVSHRWVQRTDAHTPPLELSSVMWCAAERSAESK